MTYEYHVFISYAHGKLWTPWVRDCFAPRLNAYLENEVGHLRNDTLPAFSDDQIQTGARWENVLKRKVAHSTVMVCLFSAAYFQSEWCRREMALMLEREQYCGMEGHNDNYGLLIPVRLGDGDTFPDLAERVQYQDFEEFADPDLPPGTKRASEFCISIRTLAKTIAKTLPQAKPYCADWQEFTGNHFIGALAPKPLIHAAPSRLKV
ncbi:MAG: toll/interleukin-1 receptor domain-containing protein [Methylobacter sp.]